MSLFFGVVLALAGISLYGYLAYYTFRRKR